MLGRVSFRLRPHLHPRVHRHLCPRLLAWALSLATTGAGMGLGTLTAAQAASPPPPEPPPITSLAGGWVHSGLQSGSHGGLQEGQAPLTYAYPNNLIDRGGQRGRTLIQGRLQRLASAARGSAPRLVVDGNPLLLATDAEGRFARPWSFGPGSHGVVLLDEAGRVRQRLQFLEANPLKTRAGLRILLVWDDPQAELDLHVLTPDGGHAFFAQPVLDNGGGLDVDSVDGAGPEIFSMAAPLPGPYHVYLNYWGNFGDAGYHFDNTEQRQAQPVITARITLLFDEGTGAERRETYTVPVRQIGDLTLVRRFVRL